jgi:hypothetical protein
MYINEKMLSKWKSVVLTDCLMPFRDGQPVVIRIPDNPHCWVVVFSTYDKLKASCVDLAVENYTIKQINDGKDFVESVVESGTRVMLDPYIDVVQNKTRWTEVKLE